MSTRHPAAGAGKKPRWSAARKKSAAGPQRPPRAGRDDRRDRGAWSPESPSQGAPARARHDRDGADRPARRDDRDDRRSYGRDRDDRSGAGRGRDDRRSYGNDDRRPYSRDDRRPYSRDDRRPYRRDDRRPYGNDDRRPYSRDDRRPYSRDDRRPYSRDDRRPYSRDDRRSFGRDERPSDHRDRGERPSYGRDRDDRRSYGRDSGDRPSYGRDRGDRPAYGRDRDNRGSYGRSDDRRGYGRQDDRRSYGGDRDGRRPYERDGRRPYEQRDDRRSFGDRGERRSSGDDRRSGGERSWEPRRDDRGHRPYGRHDETPALAPAGDARETARETHDTPDARDGAPATRPERDERRYERRDNRYDRRDQRETRRPDPEAQRLSRVERPVVESVEVAQDNGFAALGLPDAIVRRLARDGITTPFPIQSATIPDGLAGRDVLGRGRTGSGKTLAFGLPLLARLADGERAGANKPRSLILVPTRELAMQVSDALQPLVHVLGLRHKLVAGGMPYPPQFEALERGVDVLIATPGRLADLIERGAASLDAVEVVVLDEADHMAEMGFLEAVTEFLDQVPAGGQRLLFSATLDRGIDGLVEKYLVDPVTHSTDDGQASVTTMDHHILLVEPAHKKLITSDVANRTGRTVVFVRTKLGADRVAEQLREQGVFAAALHGGLNQGARNRVLSAFKSGDLPVLVATDVAARGIHVDDVSVVLQVDPPADHKDYLHRAGRTARAGEAGTVVTLALPHQRKLMERIAKEAGLGVSPVRVHVGDDAILAATGARRPSGVPIPEDRLRRLLDPPRRGRFGGGPGRGRGPGRPGQGRPGTPRRSGPRPQG